MLGVGLDINKLNLLIRKSHLKSCKIFFHNDLRDLFEYKCNFSGLKTMGNEFEGKILKCVIIAVAAGIFVYIIQLIVPKFIHRSGSGKGRQTI